MFNLGKSNKSNKGLDTKFSLKEYIVIINMMASTHDSTIVQILNDKNEIISMTTIDHIEYIEDSNIIYLKKNIKEELETIGAIANENAVNIKYLSEVSNNQKILILNIPCSVNIKRDKHNNASTLDKLNIDIYIQKMNELCKVHDLNVVRLLNKKGDVISITEIDKLYYINNNKMIELKKDIGDNIETMSFLNNFFIKDINYNSSLKENRLSLNIDITC